MFNLPAKYLLCTLYLSLSINAFSELSKPKDIDDRHYTKKIFRSNPDINPKKVDEAICINTNKNKFDVDKINHDSNNIKSICTVLKITNIISF